MNTDSHRYSPMNPAHTRPGRECVLDGDRRFCGESDSLARFFYGALLQADPQAADEEGSVYKSARLTISRRSAER